MNRSTPTPARALGLGDVALLVIGNVIGSGIFATPALVARKLYAPPFIIAAWILGGVVALFGAFVFGELSARRPGEGGAYGYLRDALHPVVAFAYGWSALFASFTGGIAAAAVIFSGYAIALTGLHVAPALLAALAIAIVALVNCLGVRHGGNLQNGLTVLKVVLLAAIVVAAFSVHPAAGDASAPPLAAGGLLVAFWLALVPILFSYNGAFAANFMSPEAKNASRTLPRGLWIGMAAVVAIYALLNAGAIRAIGSAGLAATSVPIAAVLRAATGSIGAQFASLTVAIATLGFVSSRMLTAPRLYRAMADDGLFFRSVGSVDPRTRVPVVAIALQALVAIAIAVSGDFAHIVTYVTSTFYLFNGLLALALFVFRARERDEERNAASGFRVPGHPITTAIYLVVSWGVTIASYVAYPREGLIGLAIVLSAVPVYYLWNAATRKGITV